VPSRAGRRSGGGRGRGCARRSRPPSAAAAGSGATSGSSPTNASVERSTGTYGPSILTACIRCRNVYQRPGAGAPAPSCAGGAVAPRGERLNSRSNWAVTCPDAGWRAPRDRPGRRCDRVPRRSWRSRSVVEYRSRSVMIADHQFPEAEWPIGVLKRQSSHSMDCVRPSAGRRDPGPHRLTPSATSVVRQPDAGTAPRFGRSTVGGHPWTPAAAEPPRASGGGRVAVSADGTRALWAPGDDTRRSSAPAGPATSVRRQWSIRMDGCGNHRRPADTRSGLCGRQRTGDHPRRSSLMDSCVSQYVP
jgi:hypothetical protein